MIERIDDVPPGVIGLRASGRLTKDEYESVLEPALKEAIDSYEARVLFVLPDFDGLEPKAWLEDVKTGLGVELKNRAAAAAGRRNEQEKLMDRASGAAGGSIIGSVVYGPDHGKAVWEQRLYEDQIARKNCDPPPALPPPAQPAQ